jgi:hypothetical protein
MRPTKFSVREWCPLLPPLLRSPPFPTQAHATSSPINYGSLISCRSSEGTICANICIFQANIIIHGQKEVTDMFQKSDDAMSKAISVLSLVSNICFEILDDIDKISFIHDIDKISFIQGWNDIDKISFIQGWKQASYEVRCTIILMTTSRFHREPSKSYWRSDSKALLESLLLERLDSIQSRARDNWKLQQKCRCTFCVISQSSSLEPPIGEACAVCIGRSRLKRRPSGLGSRKVDSRVLESCAATKFMTDTYNHKTYINMHIYFANS